MWHALGRVQPAGCRQGPPPAGTRHAAQALLRPPLAAAVCAVRLAGSACCAPPAHHDAVAQAGGAVGQRAGQGEGGVDLGGGRSGVGWWGWGDGRPRRAAGRSPGSWQLPQPGGRTSRSASSTSNRAVVAASVSTSPASPTSRACTKTWRRRWWPGCGFKGQAVLQERVARLHRPAPPSGQAALQGTAACRGAQHGLLRAGAGRAGRRRTVSKRWARVRASMRSLYSCRDGSEESRRQQARCERWSAPSVHPL